MSKLRYELIISMNIVANCKITKAYDSLSTTELHKIKREEARTMLQEYLRKWKTKRVCEDPRLVNEELDRVSTMCVIICPV
jgi:hypothetical protein